MDAGSQGDEVRDEVGHGRPEIVSRKRDGEPVALLLGRRELRLQLTGVSPEAEARLAATGDVERDGDWFTVALPADDAGRAVPDLVGDLVALGTRVHAVEPGRISLEERLLGILREGAEARAEGAP